MDNGSSHTKHISLSNQKCMIEPSITDLSQSFR